MHLPRAGHHRGPKHGTQARRQSSSRARTPRHASCRERGRPQVSVSAALGGSALIVAALGAVSLSQPSPLAAAQTVSLGAGTGARMAVAGAGEPRDSLYARALPRASRGHGRPVLDPPAALESAAEARAATRDAQLASDALQAKTYARDLVSQAWVLPTGGFHVSSWFGEPGWYWSSGYHTGVDLATACYTPAVAVSDGVVAQAGWDGPYGYQVRLTLSNGDQIWYNHLVAIETTVGAHLAKGELVGLVGETGNAYGCHLHVEYRLAADLETPLDPAPFFAAHGLPLR